MRPRETSVATSVILALVAATTLVLSTIGGINYWNARNRELESVRDLLALDANQIAPSLALPMWNFDHQQVDDVVEAMMHDPILYGLEVRAANDSRLVCARVRNDQWGVQASDSAFPTAGLLEEKRDIRFGEEKLATVTLFGTTKFAEARLRKTLFWTVLNILATNAILIGGVYLLLRRWVFGPLQEIETYASAVAGGSAKTGRAFRGELERLRRSIEKMFQLLEARYQTLRDTEEKFEKAFHSNPCGIAITEQETGKYIEVNDSLCRMFGYTPQELIGRTSVEVGIWGSAAERSLVFQPALDHGVMHDKEVQVHTRDGRSKTVLANVEMIDLNGKVCFVSLVQDITDRKRLERKHAELAAIVESSDDAIVGKTLEGQITSWNRGAERVFGYSAAEAIGQPMLMLLPPERAEEEDEILAKIRLGQTLEHFETERVRKDGRRIVIAATISPVTDERGKVIGVSKIARDITAVKQAEQALREKQAQLILAMDIAKLAQWEFDVKKNIVSADERLLKMLGTTPEQEGGLAMPPEEYIRRFVHPADAGLVAKEVGLGMATTDPNFARQFEHRFIRRDGTEGVMMIRCRIVLDKSGHSSKISGTNQDITEQRRSEERFRRMVDADLQGVIFWNTDGRITEANDAFLKIVGYTREDLVSGKIDWWTMTPPELLGLNQRVLHELTTKGVCQPYEREYVRKDGTRVPVLVGVAMLDGMTNEGVAFVLDLTERKTLERQLLRSQRMESIGTLAGGIAHDLNNVLSPIMMSLSMLETKLTDAESQELLAALSTSAQRGADMVQQVLSFARGVEGRRIEVQVKNLIQELDKLISDTFLKHIQVHASYPQNLWAVTGDPTQLHQVLLNLCVNARDAMPNGGTLTISAQNLTFDEHYASMDLEAKAGPYVLVKVEDTGSGIPSAVMENIFDPFFTTKEIGKGTGLGLSTSLAIIKSHGGFIRVASEPGKGTRFEVYLPAKVETSAIDLPAQTPKVPRGNGELILVVDDEAVVRKVTKRTLETFGYRVLLASDGTDAVRLYATHSKEIEVVLTDITMPVMDGAAVIQVLRKINSKVRIIATSGRPPGSWLNEGGVARFLAKPFSAEVLLQALAQVLSEGRGQTVAANGSTTDVWSI